MGHEGVLGAAIGSSKVGARVLSLYDGEIQGPRVRTMRGATSDARVMVFSGGGPPCEDDGKGDGRHRVSLHRDRWIVHKHTRGEAWGGCRSGGTDEPIGDNDLTRRGVPDERGRNAPARRCP